MKKTFLLLVVISVLFSCKKENETEKKIAEVPIGNIQLERFDKVFFESGPDKLPEIKEKFHYFFPEGNPDEVWVEKMKDTFQLKLYKEVQKKFPDDSKLREDLHSLFQHIKYYFPDFKAPRVVTLVSDDNDTKVVYTKKLLLIPLSLYLGKDNYLYDGLPKYQVQEFEPSQIMPNIATAYTQTKIPFDNDRTLLSLMVYYGKELYVKDRLLPDATDAEKMGYTKEQIAWSEANESEIWRYFVQNNLLYSTDNKLPSRFIEPAPFSKFYLELDNESPGRLGQWLGWQIVRSYMENNNVTLQQLLDADAKTIFDNSKYKPKK